MCKTINDLNKSNELAKKLLINCSFASFRFDSNFTLYFDRLKEEKFEGEILPWRIELEILENWWFGNKEAWNKLVNNIGEGVEPDEPVKAFELAKLRWSEGATVFNVELSDSKLVIEFENGEKIIVQNSYSDEFCFTLSSYDILVRDPSWVLTSSSDGLFFRTPIK